MNDADIYDLFKARIEAAPLYMSIVPPNCDTLPKKPYLLIDVTTIGRSNRSLSGGIEKAEGICQVTLVSETDEDELASNKEAQKIKDLFPYGLRMGNEVLVSSPSEIKQGYRDGPDWRTPVHIEYRAHTGV